MGIYYFLFDFLCTKVLNSNLMNMSSYSYDEQCIGTWIDRKPLYRKFVEISLFALSSVNKTVDIPLGIENVQHMRINLSLTLWAPISYNWTENITNYSVINSRITTITAVSGGSISIINSIDMSGMKMLVCAEYTKTTD
jgi:hypothetical protein